MNFFIFLFAVFGTVEIIINGKPTMPLRKLFSFSKIGADFIKCPLCLGFWIGIFWGYWLLPSILSLWYLSVFLNGCMGSGVAYFLHGLMPPIFEGGDE